MPKDNVQVLEINEGKKIEWKQNGYQLSFRDGDLSVRCDTRQRDWPVQYDISLDDNENLVVGVSARYVAQILIPAIQYEEHTVEDEEETELEDESAKKTHIERTPLPLKMADVVLTLWAL